MKYTHKSIQNKQVANTMVKKSKTKRLKKIERNWSKSEMCADDPSSHLYWYVYESSCDKETRK